MTRAQGEGVVERGPCTSALIGDPFLKKPTVAYIVAGGWLASKRKLYSVPQRIALAFGFWANVSVFHVIEVAVCVAAHALLLNPALFIVPSADQPGCCGG